MSNIPRRKIYEELLIFEEGILELDRMSFNDEMFNLFKKEFPNYIEKVEKSYKNIRSLLIMLFENKIYEKEEDFEKDLSYYYNNQKEIIQLIKKNKNLSKEFYENCLKIDKTLEDPKCEKIAIKELLIILDKFNSAIPKILEIRRDKMR